MTVEAQINDGLLEVAGEIILPGVQRFAVSEQFRRGAKVGDRGELGYIGPCFETHFGCALAEKVPRRVVPVWTIRAQIAHDRAIIDRIGDEARLEVSLAHVFHIMRTNASLVNSYANIAYARPRVSAALYVVFWRFFGGRWGIDAHALPLEIGWRKGDRIFGG